VEKGVHDGVEREPSTGWRALGGTSRRETRPDVYGHRRARSAWTAWLLLVALVGTSLAIWGESLHARDATLRREDRETESAMARSATDIVRSIARLDEAAGNNFAGATKIEAAKLQAFLASRGLTAHQTGVIGMAWVQPGAFIGTLDIAYAEPSGLAANTSFSLSTIQPAVEALERARDTGDPALSATFELPILSSPDGHPPMVFSVGVPIYNQAATPATAAARRSGLRGWMTAVVDGVFFEREVLARSPRVQQLDIFDGHVAAPSAAVASAKSLHRSPGPLGPTRTTSVDVLGHTWTLRSRATPAVENPQVADARRLLLIAALALSGLVFAIATLIRRSELRAWRMVGEATGSLAESEERFRALLHGSTDIVIVVDAEARLQYASPAAERLLGYPLESIIGRPGFEFVHPDDHELVAQSMAELVEGPATDEIEGVEIRVLRADGSYLDVEAVGTNGLDNPVVEGLVVNIRDISERKRAERALNEAQERFRSAFEHAPIGMGLAGPDGVIFRANRALGELVGRTTEDLVGRSIRDITHPEDWEVNAVEMRRLFAGEIQSYKMEKRYLHADGHAVWAALSASIVRDVGGEPLYMVGQMEDITERKAIGERLAHQAIHDPMTGLPNRVLFMDRLALALKRAERRKHRVAVVFLDLDQFKLVNDSLGHASGDQLLIAIADRLRGSLRPSDTVARFGGDEFTVLCDDLVEDGTALEVAERMARVVARPVLLPDGEVFVSASLGIAVSGNGDDTPSTLLRDADTAMYRAKDQGRARIELFDARTHDRAVDSLRTGNALHRALERREFELHYQPMIDLETGRVLGFEALLRWRHPERGLVHPADFIPLAEETGLIVPIGAWVLEEATKQTLRWQQARGNGHQLMISVNLAPRQLAEPSFPQEVANILARTGIDPDAVWLEITESTLMHDAESAISALRALRAQGVHLAVDDFGTGYSSLAYLKRFPVEALKVDQTFVDGLGREPEDSAIVSAVVSLAHALGLVAVAEGLETPVQLGELRTLGCDQAQGFLFGRPQPAHVIGKRPADDLRSWHRAEAKT
jgi:diguanylate cyclase (GGDEF)-like protein/PAS domain S-box-containing protein